MESKLKTLRRSSLIFGVLSLSFLALFLMMLVVHTKNWFGDIVLQLLVFSPGAIICLLVAISFYSRYLGQKSTKPAAKDAKLRRTIAAFSCLGSVLLLPVGLKIQEFAWQFQYDESSMALFTNLSLFTYAAALLCFVALLSAWNFFSGRLAAQKVVD